MPNTMPFTPKNLNTGFKAGGDEFKHKIGTTDIELDVRDLGDVVLLFYLYTNFKEGDVVNAISMFYTESPGQRELSAALLDGCLDKFFQIERAVGGDWNDRDLLQAIGNLWNKIVLATIM